MVSLVGAIFFPKKRGEQGLALSEGVCWGWRWLGTSKLVGGCAGNSGVRMGLVGDFDFETALSGCRHRLGSVRAVNHTRCAVTFDCAGHSKQY